MRDALNFDDVVMALAEQFGSPTQAGTCNRCQYASWGDVEFPTVDAGAREGGVLEIDAILWRSDTALRLQIAEGEEGCPAVPPNRRFDSVSAVLASNWRHEGYIRVPLAVAVECTTKVMEST